MLIISSFRAELRISSCNSTLSFRLICSNLVHIVLKHLSPQIDPDQPEENGGIN